MPCRNGVIFLSILAAGCAAEPEFDPTADYRELEAVKILDAPEPKPGNFAPENRFLVERGKYLVELLGCGSCHTDGALEGAPRLRRSLAGSRIGIAYMNPFRNNRPGVVYPPNITPDEKTGIGSWSDAQIADAIRAGLGRHTRRRIAVMPWQGYARLEEEDLRAIVGYLRSIEAVEHEVPAEVRPGRRATEPFVYFGTYRSN